MTIIIGRDRNEGFLNYTRSSDGQSFPLQINGDIFKIRERFSSIQNATDYQIKFIQTTDGIPTYRILNPIVSGGGRKIINQTSNSDLEITSFTPGTVVENVGMPLTVNVTGGTAPYTYKWYALSSGTGGNNPNQAIAVNAGFTSQTCNVELSFLANIKTVGIVAVRVTDARGFSQTREYYFEYIFSPE